MRQDTNFSVSQDTISDRLNQRVPPVRVDGKFVIKTQLLNAANPFDGFSMPTVLKGTEKFDNLRSLMDNVQMEINGKLFLSTFYILNTLR